MADDEPATIPTAAELRALAKREAVKAGKRAETDAVAATASRQARFDRMVPFWVNLIKTDIGKGLTAVARMSAKTPIGEIQDYSNNVFAEYSTTAGRTTATIKIKSFISGDEAMEIFAAAWGIVAAELAAGKYECGVNYDFHKAYNDPDEGYHAEGYYASVTLAWRER